MKRSYKLLFILITIIICIEIIVGCSLNISNIVMSTNPPVKDRLQAIKEKGVLTLASSNDKPYAYIDPDTNKIRGIDGEIITEAAKRLGINNVQLKEVPFSNLLNALNSDDTIDIASDGIYITDDRQKQALFTIPFYKSSEVIITPKVSKINFKEDLANAVVGAQNGTLSLMLAKTWQEKGLLKEIQIFETKSELIDAVNTGKVDAGIIDNISIAYQIPHEKTLYLKIIKPYAPEISGLIAAAVRKSDTTLLNAINEKIYEMKIDKTIKNILEKYGLEDNYLA
ncbi:ABC transporter substrate-binding protein [Clostridium sp.]|uniref:ABC transporter substrate-binding protein n=1 Tax=Clostridium sp. TaxID=1506 RepID=UPI00283B7934|nr:ABC transporter substrate-binding protein [Clostridium sp.]MDR3597608.1 ABC transporter substrate-binding protein [Clostridium sp.]